MDHTHDIADPGHGHDYYDQYSYGDNVHSYILSYPTWSGGKYTERLRTSDSNFTGISVTGVSAGYRAGAETRPKNMNVIFIMRVY